jgi:dTDP-4-dehydrorhamnose reductase
MTRILVTGVSGQVGGALREALSSVGVVLAADRSVLDLSRPDSLLLELDRLSHDLIVNAAAYTAVDQAEDERELAYRINVESPRMMAKWAARQGVPMVHFSTDYVFDGSGDRPWREDDPTGPLSTYGASKLASECAVAEADASYLIIRTSWVFASKGKNFLTTIARLARERPELRVVADQIGAPTSARSIAQGVISIIGSCPEHEAGSILNSIKRRFAEVDGLIHMSSRGATNWHGFATAIVDGLRVRGQQLAVHNIAAIDTKDYPSRAVRPLNSRLDMSRLETVIGIQMPDWQEALETELNDYVLNMDRAMKS